MNFKNHFLDEEIQFYENKILGLYEYFENQITESNLTDLNEFGEVCSSAKASMSLNKEKAKATNKNFKECKTKFKNCQQKAKKDPDKLAKKERLTGCKEHYVNCMEKEAEALEGQKDAFKKAKEKASNSCTGKKLLKGAGNLLKKGLKKGFSALTKSLLK